MMRGMIVVWSMAVVAALAGCQGTSTPKTDRALQATEQKTEQKAEAPMAKVANPMIVITTSEGAIKVELWPDKAPATVANFLAYAKEGFYDGTIFHRVIKDFMIQGGGFTADMKQKATHAQIKNEARSDAGNSRGTIAMARTSVVDSATAQFFINVVDNKMLNHRDETPAGFGYCVFGQVVEGLDVVDRIRQVKTHTVGPFGDVPVKAVVIESVKVVDGN